MSPTAAPPRELAPRDLEILKDVILTHFLSAEPVSSRTVARYGATDLSAATIRNVMADLEELGYLSQPHTSAGRVPTPAGYHLFIDSLMLRQKLTAQQRRHIRRQLTTGGDADDLMEAASRLLSEMSNQVGIVVTPVLGRTVVKAIEFVPVAERRVLCIVVSAGGFLDNKVIDTDEELSREDLVRVSNYLTENYGGRTLVEIRDDLVERMVDERAAMDRLMGQALDLARRGLDGASVPDVRLDGTSTVLHHPELSDLGRVRRLVDTFADKARLVRMLNDCIRGDGVRVLIGEDSDLTSELDFSLVATTYGTEHEVRGTLGIFGPSRMQYQWVIPLVQFLGKSLSQALTDTYAPSAAGPEG